MIRTIAAFALLIFFACPGAHAQDSPAPGKVDAPASSIKVLTYNIHHGRGADGMIDLKRIAAVIKKSGADLVALQEVDKKTKRANGVDQAAELGRLTGMHHAFGKAIDFSGGEYGDAVLSRFPIKQSIVIPLPTAAGKEDRVAVAVTVKALGRTIVFAGTHLSHEKGSSGERLKAFETIRKMLLEKFSAKDMILAGDFNAQPDSAEIKKLRTLWVLPGDTKNALTFPANEPTIRIDYICVDKRSRLKCPVFRVIDEKQASDHRPVLAELTAR